MTDFNNLVVNENLKPCTDGSTGHLETFAFRTCYCGICDQEIYTFDEEQTKFIEEDDDFDSPF